MRPWPTDEIRAAGRGGPSGPIHAANTPLWRRTCLAVLRYAASVALVAGLIGGSSHAADTSLWMSLDGTVLELKLAHDEGGQPDGGLLRINPTSRTVTWAGIPGELGCRETLQVPFESVRAVRLAKGAGFVLQVKDHKTLTFLPVVHAPWFQRQFEVKSSWDQSVNQAIKEGRIATAEPKGGAGGSVNPFGVNGDAAFGGPKIQHVALPEDVVADTRLAVDGILDALGRTPSPGLRLREALYGSPEEVDVSELASSPSAFDGTPIKVRGAIEVVGKSILHLKRGEVALRILPSSEVETAFRALLEAGATQDVELTGVFRMVSLSGPPPPSGEMSGALNFWDFVRPTAEVSSTGPAEVSLETLANDPHAFDSKTIRVVGKFRGNNLFADLPSTSWKHVTDFVIKDGAAAIWVTGFRPQGKGWRLDPQAPGDTQNWVSIVGRPKLQGGVLYLKAETMEVTPPPSGHAGVKEVRRFVGAAQVAPDVVFVLPLPEEPVSRSGLFIIQFNKGIDPTTFKGHVQLRYVGREHAFSRLNWTYDEDRRALVIEPGEQLAPRSKIEILLLSGVVDNDGQPLHTSSGDADFAYRLRYQVAGS